MPEINERANEELTELLRVADIVDAQTGMPGAAGSLLLLCHQAQRVAKAVRTSRLHARREG
jgi:hypothetical protein